MSNIIKSHKISFKDGVTLLVNNEENRKILETKESETDEISDSSLDITIREEENEKQIKRVEELENLNTKIEKANEDYNNLISQTEEKRKELLKNIEFEKQQIFDNAKEEGYNLGYENGKQKAETEYNNLKEELDKNIATKMKDIESKKLETFKKVKESIKELTINILKNLLKNDVELNKKLIEALILKGLSEITEEINIKITLSDNDYNNIDKIKLSEMSKNGNKILIISDKNYEDGNCIIETEIGYIDCGFSECFKIIETIIDKHTHI